jgi:hypothetical protein
MHENREICCTSWSDDQDRCAKAINRTADMNVQEKSDCAVVPVNPPNQEGQPSAEAGEGRAQTEENIGQARDPRVCVCYADFACSCFFCRGHANASPKKMRNLSISPSLVRRVSRAEVQPVETGPKLSSDSELFRNEPRRYSC